MSFINMSVLQMRYIYISGSPVRKIQVNFGSYKICARKGLYIREHFLRYNVGIFPVQNEIRSAITQEINYIGQSIVSKPDTPATLSEILVYLC
jgi:hypothetical protein